MADRHYVGSGWEKQFEAGGSVINLSLKKAELDKLPVDAHGNIGIVVATRRTPDSLSKATHTVYENTFRKEKTGV